MSYLSRVDDYLHAAPLSGATGQQVGPFTLFRSTTIWPYYARPIPGTGATIGSEDLAKLRARCEELELPMALEWVVETCPSLGPAATEAGLEVHEYPLLVLERADFTPVATSLDCRILPASPDVLRQARAVASVGFGASGTAVGDDGIEARDRAAAELPEETVATLIERAEAGVSVTAGVFGEQGLLASGLHQPVGATSEIVGVATLPAMRRQGLGAAVTSCLVEHALAHGVELVLLSAESDAVAAVYERVGFRRIGRAGAVESAV
ncbi:GNAT family N-acetyltransferase [Kribbella sp. CA-293567]|uniref:GNAT family N-acetyltransferase n=1 Tax=Kribbella sp. CA-293567 TaxID=3002436 RepID=UPI0022DE1236|nr:GNAT family N-acetyltransferase [Kribbella sp. CA-293567]WBQ06574.1 GNAT family N-acetyltransferase [Kribbella sp. CA-293567]